MPWSFPWALWFLSMEEKKILIIAGEPSGDLHGANLIKSLKKEKRLEFFGIGGDNLKKEGVEIVAEIEKIAVVGFFEVIFKLPYLYYILKKVIKKIKKEKPSLAILIDYPGFNFILMKKLYKMNIPVVYYICPQVWAWKEERVEDLKKYTKKRLVIFPFEEDFFKKKGVEAIYVGNPLLDLLTKEEVKEEEGKIKIGIFPGSRESEIKKLLPKMIKILLFLSENIKNVDFFIKIYKPIEKLILKEINKTKLKFNLIEEKIPSLTFSIMASGTITLENALIGNPGIVLYELNPLTYFFIKNKVKTKYISITNILLGEMVYDELIQRDIDINKINDFILNLIKNKNKLKEKKEKLLKLKEVLKHGAVEKAKEEILKLL